MYKVLLLGVMNCMCVLSLLGSEPALESKRSEAPSESWVTLNRILLQAQIDQLREELEVLKSKVASAGQPERFMKRVNDGWLFHTAHPRCDALWRLSDEERARYKNEQSEIRK